MPNDNEFLLQFFASAHLPEHLRKVSAPFCDLAHALVEALPRNPERTTALRKLLEAKDCAVRALVAQAEPSLVVHVHAQPVPKPTPPSREGIVEHRGPAGEVARVRAKETP